MGLGAPKRRNKLSHDPNNTAWTRATDNYGHKILSRQGWTPGSYLGATNASHADHYTAANASHIRVLLREDNLGLGAQVGKTNAETFGLSLFSGVLGRLNGKSEGEVQKQQDAFRDLELRTYQERKYGMVGFVSGGFLVGDRIRRTKEEEDDDQNPVKEERKPLKREADDDVEETKPSKRIKPSRAHEVTIKSEPQSETDSAVTKPHKEKKHKKKDHVKSKSAANDAEFSERQNTDNQDERAARKAAKAEKRARKEARRKKKEEKASRRSKKEQEVSAVSESDTSSSQPPADDSMSRPNSAMPAMGGRQAVRHRYIQQKRMASMDAQAMKEIFMMKATG